MPIHLVVFDLGNVLVRLVTGWEDACRFAGVDPIGTGNFQRHHALVCAFELGQTPEHEYLRGAAECFPALAPGQFESIFDAWLRGPYPRLPEMLTALKSRRIRTACLSNTNARHWRIALDPAGPYSAHLALIDHLFASHLIGAAKPDPAAYRHVEQVTGVAAPNILFFDDREENVTAAREAGWRAEKIDPAQDGVEQAAAHLRAAGLL